MATSNRIEVLQSKLPQGVDCAIITSSCNRYYLTGMRSSAGTLLVSRNSAYFIIDFRYIELAKSKVKNAKVILQDKLFEQIGEIFAKEGIKTVEVEPTYMTMGEYLRMREKLSDVKVLESKGTDELLLDMRAHKDAEELKNMRAAQAIADKGFTHILGYIKPGVTERQIALELQTYLMAEGAEKLSFDTIAVSGVNSSLPHGVPSDKKVEDGDFVTMDFGVVVNGYCSDMTRTVAVGHATDEMRKIYDLVLRAHNESMAAVKPGVENKMIDKIARDIIYGAGYEGCFGHGLGHSVGLEIHESPRYSALAEGCVEVGHVMTIEPGIYLEGRFGVRIEDSIYVGEDGIIDLATSPKELIVL